MVLQSASWEEEGHNSPVTAEGLGWTHAYRQLSLWAWQPELRGLWAVTVLSVLLS